MGRLAYLLLVVVCIGAATVLGDGDKWFPRGGSDIRLPEDGIPLPLHPPQDGASPLSDGLQCPDSEPAQRYTCRTKRNIFVFKIVGIPIFTSHSSDQDCTTSASDQVSVPRDDSPLHGELIESPSWMHSVQMP